MNQEMVRVRAVRSFMDIRVGDESVCPLDSTVQGWISAGHVIITERLSVPLESAGPEEPERALEVQDGETEAGPGSAEPNDAGRVKKRR